MIFPYSLACVIRYRENTTPNFTFFGCKIGYQSYKRLIFRNYFGTYGTWILICNKTFSKWLISNLSPVSTEPKEPETTLMSLQSFQKAYQKISQLNQFLISMTYGLFTRTAVKIELGHAAIPQLLQSSTKFVLSNMLYFNSTNRLHNNKRDIQHLVFTLQPFLLCGENAGKIRK